MSITVGVPELLEHVTARAAEIRCAAALELRALSEQTIERERVAERDDSAEAFRRLSEKRAELWMVIRCLEGQVV